MRDINLRELRKLNESYSRMVLESNETFDHIPTLDEISPSRERVSIDGNFCKKWYSLFNRWYFGNRLPQNLKIDFIQFSTDKKTLGFAHSDWKFLNGRKTVYPTKIEINAIYGYNEYQFFDTLIHEMIHILDFQCFPEHYEIRNYKCHGAWFHSECDRLSQYGWKISTYDTTGATWSPEYYDEKTEALKNSGKTPLIGFVEKDSGEYFITKTDTKSYMNNAMGCVAQSANTPSKIKSITYYEIHGCKFAIIKNELKYWKSKLSLDSSVIRIYKERGRIPENPFYTFVPDERTSSKSKAEQEFDNMVSNKKKLVKGALLALADSLYSTAYSNYEVYSGKKEDLESLEMDAGSYTVPAFKTLNGYKLVITLANGNYDETNRPTLRYDQYDKTTASIIIHCGNILNCSYVKTALADTIDNIENIRDEADGMIPQRMWDSWDNMDYRDNVCAPKVVFKEIKDNPMIVGISEQIVDGFLSAMKSEIENSKKVSESFILEDADEDDYDVRHHSLDDYARTMYDKFTNDGDIVKITVKDENTIDFAIF